MRGEIYQITLIILGIIGTVLLGLFFYDEFFPEYKEFQKDFVQLEEFRSSYTKEQPPFFQYGIKQIVLEREDKGPPVIDRCTSCHVALEIPDYSPKKIARNINGQILRDSSGRPLLELNPNYVWLRLEQKIDELKDEKVNQQLLDQGEKNEVEARLKLAEKYENLKIIHADKQVYSVEKALQMHPLIGNETRPFEFHPIQEYGCTSCHNGNGRSLSAIRAHGPVFDGTYEPEFMGPKPKFIEEDPKNDPLFARVFNEKPGHDLLFDTTPLYVGALIQAKCIDCHQRSDEKLYSIDQTEKNIQTKWMSRYSIIEKSYENDVIALSNLVAIKKEIEKNGLQATLKKLKQQQQDFAKSEGYLENLASQEKFLESIYSKGPLDEKETSKQALKIISQKIVEFLGSERLQNELEKSSNSEKNPSAVVKEFIIKHQKDSDADGAIFKKFLKLDFDRSILIHVKENEEPFIANAQNQDVITALKSDVDLLTENFQKGKELFISQACYACHRIAGFSRGGVGPELTREGLSYPWFVKESIVWPQADLKTSTMPNTKMDHEEVENLLTYMLAQRGNRKAVAESVQKQQIQAWEAGEKQAFEKSVTPAQMLDLRYSMTIFATEGCASCHRLKGFESNTGFAIEKSHPGFDELYKEKEWFTQLFPEGISGSQIIKTVEQHKEEIDQKIADNIRAGSIIEEIEKKSPGTIESFYTPFKYASRAKNSYFNDIASNEKNLEKKEGILRNLEEWKKRIHKILMIYIQEYGLGRIIGPRPNWSGVYRSDEWLMEHFRNPTSHIPRSIMPVMPFDDTKFYALTHLLDVLGIRNRNEIRQIWAEKGFNPQLAYRIHCSQCHGENLQGDGPVAEWIYPIPKNLQNPDFLRNLTKQQAIISIRHGVKGTPMPPWGETPSDKSFSDGIPVLTAFEIDQLADWLFSLLPGTDYRNEKNIPKWQYGPKDILKELEKENPLNTKEEKNEKEIFDEIPNSIPDEDKHLYYIKRKFYTPENLQAGEQFFALNCVVCHGGEADGTGIRAGSMIEAKPRMLTNVNWLNTRDDLRLLRSIKYGVPGTSMAPWGDLTSMLQRLQLVMYIRSLSTSKNARDQLMQDLYKTFDAAIQKIQNARVENSKKITQLQLQQRETKQEEQDLSRKAKEGEVSTDMAANAYKKYISQEKTIMQLIELDQNLIDLKNEVKNEQDKYQSLGLNLLAADLGDEINRVFFKMLEEMQNSYTFTNNILELKTSPEASSLQEKYSKILLKAIQDKISLIQQEIEIEKGKITSPESNEKINALSQNLLSLKKFQEKLLSGFEEIRLSSQKQQEIIKQYNKQMSGHV